MLWPETVKTPLGVGCSGGADSVFLLLAAWLKYGSDLCVLHLNHALRGAESDADAAFVEKLATELGLTFIGQKLESPPVNASEAWLREQRLAFYRKSGCATILLGHHADDVAETMLMRLTRGSGTEGLAAPLPVYHFADGLRLIRPLLETPKADILDALTQNDIPWREDASNATPDYFRNRVREKVLPRLLKAAPGNARAGLRRSHRLLAEDAEALSAWLESLSLEILPGKSLSVKALQGKPPALWRRAVQRWLGANNLLESLTASAVDELLLRLLRGESGSMSAGDGICIVFNNNDLKLDKAPSATPATAWPSVLLHPGATLWLPTGQALRAERVELDTAARQEILAGNISPARCVYLSMEAAALPVLVRQWRDGDRYRPLGAPGSRKLQDVFTDAKIPALERKRLPVVCSPTGDILWIPGLAPAEAAKINTVTQWALRLTYAPH
ncbi:tRNA lysidine(34) synthetase TilS [Ruficoccus sp. ZRK36]|uniref:tRNA lysidine(34) synthetase TilS n=1 Tax=Ruficoccus sp. ZRK36 TaxID=2866311 RepID=UPI001C72E3E7|nr:tRNA lysidine(34) synthetase TilS [Ruficoccus sp. ZRK36]QYY35137.1 tRNA lysidine(34) synthetase TilS [Ruficoccus sp. ZRK36]